ncbi:MAG TPA: hypothetical protein DIC34_19625 [Treponema sp.]|nr:MAG: hypothetical protein A2Y36_14200 [Treponema sp. GWA1_62_8]OHE63557.1 MAG: hypothetical protein A2001_16765 [Treponema sp. GWC1_61_84]OHE74765.1 MAG: hypothetical protein A2413_03415 [Treponema sp. RIFOXYC1_FULL_61_9]HCM28711.1 hypothetical protein [Treponema sp.]
MRAGITALLLLFVSASVFAQNSLLDNPNYRRSLDLQRQAKSAYDSGDFLKSAEQSKEAEVLSRTARAEAETQLQRWTANSWKNRAAARIAFGERVDAAGRYPEVWPPAQEAYAQAVADYDAERFDSSIAASRKVVELLTGIAAAPAPEKPPAAQVVEPAPVPAAEPASPVLPEFYTVRLIVERRDCFWNIAGYPFVYGDPTKWPILYEANKDRIPDSGNPHLILPGEVFVIPSIRGESRSGTWSE